MNNQSQICAVAAMGHSGKIVSMIFRINPEDGYTVEKWDYNLSKWIAFDEEHYHIRERREYGV